MCTETAALLYTFQARRERRLPTHTHTLSVFIRTSANQNGVHIKQRATSVALSTPLVQLLKSQDAGAVRAQLRAEQRRLSVLVQRIAPAVPGMAVGWLREPVRRDYLERSRRRVLQDAGLLLKPEPKGKGKGKAKEDAEGGLYAGLYADPHEGEDDFDDAGDDEEAVVGAAGRKTVWCDGIEQREWAGTRANR